MDEFFNAVASMREAQKQYFYFKKTRQMQLAFLWFDESLKRERVVDEMIKAKQEPTLL